MEPFTDSRDVVTEDQHGADESAPEYAVSNGSSAGLLSPEFDGSIRLPKELRKQQAFIRFLMKVGGDKQLLEPIHRLRDNILRTTLRRGADTGGQILALTGVDGQEGTSWIALMLSLSLGACTHRKIAFLDGSFDPDRFEALSVLFHLNRNEFSAENGANKVWAYSNAVQPNVHFLTSPSAENSLEFFSDRDCVSFFEEMRRHFDFLVLDTAPLLKDSSNVFIGPTVDQLYLVTAAGKTRLADVEKCVEYLEVEGTDVTGVVVNKQKIPLLSRCFGKKYFF